MQGVRDSLIADRSRGATMRTLSAFAFLAAILGPPLHPATMLAVSCASQSQMTEVERNTLVTSSRQIATDVEAGNVEAVRAATIPSVASQFGEISSAIAAVAPLTRGAVLTVSNLYSLDASDLPAAEEQTQFFCGGQDSPEVNFSIPQIPPGKYAIAVLHATGVAQPQQISLLLSQGTQQAGASEAATKSPAASTATALNVNANAGVAAVANPWKLAGLFVRPLTSAGRDGLWYWTKARTFAKAKQNWNAYFYYRTAASLLIPVEFVSSPNLDKLLKEQSAVAPDTLPGEKPMVLSSNGHTYSITGLHTEGSLGGLDLVIAYQSTDNSDPVSTRTRNFELMQAMLSQHPELREGFHGLWVYSNVANQRPFANELTMSQIP